MLSKNFLDNSCTNCGFCTFYFKDNIKININLKIFENKELKKDDLKKLKSFCPGFGLNYLPSNYKNFKKFNYLVGPYVNSYVGHSLNDRQKRKSSSGGILTEILVYLLKNKIVDAIYMPIQSKDKLFPEYKMENNIKVIRENSQSIYTKIPINTNFRDYKKFKKICFVGLPDQTQALKKIRTLSTEINKKIKIVIGPMVGINMDAEVIDGIRKVFNIKKNLEIKKIRWRDGEWPGYLNIRLSNNKSLKIKKFYYNFLLPFYCSQETLVSNDFANEAADISVGDAWSPKYEKIGGGWSMVWAKTPYGDNILKKLKFSKKILLNKVPFDEAIKMHTHILDFKKRGSLYRKDILKFFNINVPKDKVYKDKFYLSRFLIELIILSIIYFCKSKIGRFLLKWLNSNFLGFIFEKTRYFWKNLTKNTKRRGFNKLNRNVFQKNN